MACTGSSPTQPRTEAVASLSVSAPSSLIVHETALLEVTALDARGRETPLPEDLLWETSDPAVARVTREGVISARGRGLATIGVSSGAIRAEAAVRVRARVKITPGYRYRPCGTCDGNRIAFWSSPYGSTEEYEVWSLAIGDTLHLAATYVDVDGLRLEEEPSATWSSSNPDAVSVNADGDVVGLAWPDGYAADIIASTDDGTDQTQVQTLNAVAGLPATLRLGHAAFGAGPITFTYNRGEPVTLSFGESVDIPISSGLFFVDIRGSFAPDSTYGSWQGFGAMVQGDDRLDVFAVGDPQPLLAGAWDRPTAVPDDSVRVRLIQSSSAGVVWVLPPDAPADGLPELCYFDPGGVWGFDERPTGGLDFVLAPKYGNAYEPVRIRATPEPGHSVTYAIAESAAHVPNLLAFPDS